MRTVPLFQAHCDDCDNNFSTPRLSEFEYGSFIFYGLSGRVFGLFEAIGHPIWQAAELLIIDRLSEQNKDQSPRSIQEALAKLADPIENNPLTLSRICPVCQSTQNEYDESVKQGEIELPIVTFEKYFAMDVTQRKTFVREFV